MSLHNSLSFPSLWQSLYHMRRKGSTRKGIYFSSRGLPGIICHACDSKPSDRLGLHVMQSLYHERRKGSTRKGIYFSSRGLPGIICHGCDSKPSDRLGLHVMQSLYHERRKGSTRKGIYFLSCGLPGIICHGCDSKPSDRLGLHVMQLLYHISATKYTFFKVLPLQYKARPNLPTSIFYVYSKNALQGSTNSPSPSK